MSGRLPGRINQQACLSGSRALCVPLLEVRPGRLRMWSVISALLALPLASTSALSQAPLVLPGTSTLEWQDAIDVRLMDGAHRFVDLYEHFGLGDRTAIHYFNGGHTISGQATFDFLHRHLDWPEP